MDYRFPAMPGVTYMQPQVTPQNQNMNLEIERIVRTAIKILTRVEGPLFLRDLTREVGNIATPNNRLSERQMHDLLRNYPNNFVFSKHETSDDDVVGAVTKLSLCKEHCSKFGACPGLPVCSGLHVCKFYLLSNSCRFSKSNTNNSCVYGHDLTNQHNKYLLNQNLIDHLTVTELRYLFRTIKSRTKTTLPNICKFYNVSSGCRSEVAGKVCPYIHICRHYILDQCRFGKNCKRNHNVNHPQVKEILSKHGISTQRTPKEVLADLRDAQMNEFDDNQSIGSQSSGATGHSKAERMMSNMRLEDFSSDEESDGTQGRAVEDSMNSNICIFYLRGRCAFGRGCQKHHKELPYQWQYKYANTGTSAQSQWSNIDQDSNVDLELNYCDANKAECYLKLRPGEVIQVNFDTMSGQGYSTLQLRRLSTPSSYEEKFSPLATSWKWYWLDEDGWREYGVDSSAGYKAMLSSDELEQKYLENPTGQMKFATLGHQYVMDFKKKVQTNLVYKTERCVRRRPLFVSPKDFMHNKKRNPSVKNGGSQQSDQAITAPLMHPLMSYIPPEWTLDRAAGISNIIGDHFKRVQIYGPSLALSEECRRLQDLFFNTMPGTAKITSIERVQNGELWMNFVSKREKMKRKKKNGDVNEMRLFHGTTRDYVDAICRQGFDFRFSGKTSGNLYGKGSYFAKNADYANHYSDYQSEKEMFLSRVLVGDYAKGHTKYVRPPPRNPADPFELYDSCVDSTSNPSIFVIFTFDQVYPEYVIRYVT